MNSNRGPRTIGEWWVKLSQWTDTSTEREHQ